MNLSWFEKFWYGGPKIECSKGGYHKFKDGYWTIGRINRDQSEGHNGWFCTKCYKITYYHKSYKTGEYTIKSLEECRAKHSKVETVDV